MIAKITTFGENRQKAIQRAKLNLNSINISGITTNVMLLLNILNSVAFMAGEIHTQWLKNNIKNNPDMNTQKPNESLHEIAIIAVALLQAQQQEEDITHTEKASINQWKQQQWK